MISRYEEMKKSRQFVKQASSTSSATSKDKPSAINTPHNHSSPSVKNEPVKPATDKKLTPVGKPNPGKKIGEGEMKLYDFSAQESRMKD